MNLDRRWWIAIGVVVVVLVALVVSRTVFRPPPEECGPVQELLDFNRSQSAAIESKFADSQGIPDASEEAAYQAWADGLADRAQNVSSPELALTGRSGRGSGRRVRQEAGHGARPSRRAGAGSAHATGGLRACRPQRDDHQEARGAVRRLLGLTARPASQGTRSPTGNGSGPAPDPPARVRLRRRSAASRQHAAGRPNGCGCSPSPLRARR